MKTIATICAAAAIALLFAGTVTALDAPEDDLGELDGFWTPIPDGPEHRDARDDLRLRNPNTDGPGETRAM